MAVERPAPQNTHKFRSEIVVVNKDVISNPEETALMRRIRAEGLPIKSVEIGKLFQLTHSAPNTETAHQLAEELAERPLANPVYEEVKHVKTLPVNPIKTE